MKIWVYVQVKVETAPGNMADYTPSIGEVAADIRQRVEGVDLDTGWIITKVGA